MIMRRRYSEKEIKDRLKRLEILADTREQVWEHVESALAGQKIAVQRGKLDFGDYTALIPDGTGGCLLYTSLICFICLLGFPFCVAVK